MGKQSTAAKSSILDVLNAATETDLEAIDARIAELEAAIQQHEATILSLKSVRRTIDIKLHGKPERKKPVRKVKGDGSQAKGDDNVDRQRIHDWLSKHGEPAKPGVIGAALGIHSVRVASLCRHVWFEESLAGFGIA